jgi:hypothetical protein
VNGKRRTELGWSTEMRSMIRRWVLPAVFCLAIEDGAPLSGEVPPGPKWLQTAVFYQVYPQSYYDSNGDEPWQLPTSDPACIAVREELKKVMKYWLELGASLLLRASRRWRHQSFRRRISPALPDNEIPWLYFNPNRQSRASRVGECGRFSAFVRGNK